MLFHYRISKSARGVTTRFNIFTDKIMEEALKQNEKSIVFMLERIKSLCRNGTVRWDKHAISGEFPCNNNHEAERRMRAIKEIVYSWHKQHQSNLLRQHIRPRKSNNEPAGIKRHNRQAHKIKQ